MADQSKDLDRARRGETSNQPGGRSGSKVKITKGPAAGKSGTPNPTRKGKIVGHN